MRFASSVIGCAALAVAAPAAAQTADFKVPAGRLSDALNILASQAGITIGSTDPAIASVRSKAVSGRMSVSTALTRLLAGTGYTFNFVTRRTVRIVRAAPPKKVASRRPTAAPAPAPAPAVAVAEPSEIVVTASKQGVPLERYGGTVTLVDVQPDNIGRFGTRGSDAILEQVATLSSTSLGPGRNKIFIRGVADSSFNGPSQAIVGQYLGDVRLTFNAPDPDLQLYDIDRVEVLEGPQGTLYGSGALGGIMRIVPNEPDLTETSANVAAGILATEHGGIGRDLSATVNLPIVSGRLSARVVGYATRDAGYIDDTLRGLTNINSVGTHGGRLTLLWTPGDDWRITAGAAAQFIAGDDSQYALRGHPPLSRASALGQPFDNDYRLGQAIIAKSWQDLELVSATGLVKHDLETILDATEVPGTSSPIQMIEDISIRLIANETRISRPDTNGMSWLAGWSILHDISDISRRLGPPGATAPITGIRNEVTEGALFGQYSRTMGDRFTATVGGRLTFSRSVGLLLDTPEEAEEPHRTDIQFSPTLAGAWRANPSLTIYGRFQKGFRAGGLAVSAAGSTTSAQRFESDNLASFEAGLRLSEPARDRFDFSAAVSYTRWDDMQADLIDTSGLPYTTNLGDGRIYGLELGGNWRISPRFRLEAAVFLNSSSLSNPAPAFSAAQERDLPNIATAGGRIGGHYETDILTGVGLSIDGSVRYVGASRLGIGEPIDIPQGNYVEARLGTRLNLGSFGISLDVDNITDTRGNRFSFGNPFSIDERNQITPVRPRTVRLGFDADF